MAAGFQQSERGREPERQAGSIEGSLLSSNFESNIQYFCCLFFFFNVRRKSLGPVQPQGEGITQGPEAREWGSLGASLEAATMGPRSTNPCSSLHIGFFFLLDLHDAAITPADLYFMFVLCPSLG